MISYLALRNTVRKTTQFNSRLFASLTSIQMSIGRKTFRLVQWYGVALKQVTMPCAFPMWLAAWSAWMSLTPKIAENMFRNKQSCLLRGMVFPDTYHSQTLGKLHALVCDSTVHVHKLPWDLIRGAKQQENSSIPTSRSKMPPVTVSAKGILSRAAPMQI